MINDREDSKSNTLFKFVENSINSIKKTLGIVDKAAPISFEISEFMQEVTNSLEKLPKKYKKLYELTPKKTDFIVGRESELEKLTKIYEDWEKDRFVSCAIVAQKGSGVSSILNIFLKKAERLKIIRDEIGEKISTKEQYFRYFNSLFQTENLSTNQDFIDHLNNDKNSKIIVLENLHHMFLKKVDGFEAIELLFELISYTTKKVLWIGVFTPESWKYLDKTIAISNYFTSVITLEPLKLENIKETIQKRSQSADLEMFFLQENDQNKEQDTLKENYFKQLYKLSNGNISLVLLYWVRSIEKIEEKKIFLKHIDELDSSFVENLSTEALFVLQTLILHDGLTLNDYTTVTGESSQECRKQFMPMLEKGILIQPKKKYNINPAIYKHIHNYLSSKNYIH